MFQYPLRVEVGCNLLIALALKPCVRSFSTLYGSKWVATRYLVLALVLPAEFQYPLRVEVGCNLDATPSPEALKEVSVPSTGRSGLQLSRVSEVINGQRVSVPSTGRSGLQPREIFERHALIEVSVPSTGRSGLQPPTILNVT